MRSPSTSATSITGTVVFLPAKARCSTSSWMMRSGEETVCTSSACAAWLSSHECISAMNSAGSCLPPMGESTVALPAKAAITSIRPRVRFVYSARTLSRTTESAPMAPPMLRVDTSRVYPGGGTGSGEGFAHAFGSWEARVRILGRERLDTGKGAASRPAHGDPAVSRSFAGAPTKTRQGGSPCSSLARLVAPLHGSHRSLWR